jgi:hypothetical protein
MRDFLVLDREYSSSDYDLFAEEIAAQKQQDAEWSRGIPGLLGPADREHEWE